jgi:hypothetical protein
VPFGGGVAERFLSISARTPLIVHRTATAQNAPARLGRALLIVAAFVV